MIILDTNVASALMRLQSEPAVDSWLRKQVGNTLHITTVSIFEIQFGIERFPAGRKRTQLEVGFASVLRNVIAGRILQLDHAAAMTAAVMHVKRGKSKANVEAPDSLIAGAARHHGAVVATRNAKDFGGLGLTLVDPWK